MDGLLNLIQFAIRGKRLSIGNEKRLQNELEEAFTLHNINFIREVYLDKNNIVDFMIEGLAIEVKIMNGSSSMQIYRQLERYSNFPEVKALMLMTAFWHFSRIIFCKLQHYLL
ncbi:hypothetical protein [Aquamicrobium sp.]|uniref:hypothetical protein n=1 Tax=Aquamicrobium sp. TaxID=1872579 RepID=UPI002586CADF|nr:hypothetical protein [Aquamicrobium sp.]MCK9549273.1 hypothetical protein [Aquamicrobium sp.]